ncbi:M20/M25/M40 family metallo-hydrolase [Candidatus Daviesbacteria bacterium]|nr:M20/M25/M40 family metallo-hydrolase [Candidatus Daviesbacteria bacterium]
MTAEIKHQTLKNLVEIPSVYPNERQISVFCADLLTTWGFKVETVDLEPGRSNVLATKGQGDKAILFYGHLDTVDPSAHQWDEDKPPFRLTLIGSRYYGVGTSDMKGGISAFFEATKNTPAYVKIMLGVDEENISAGAWAVVDQRKDFFADVELIIAAESAFTTPPYGLTVGRVGRTVYQAIFKGQAEHLINYKQGKDAIWMLSRFGARLYAEREQMFTSPFSVAQIRRVEGESVGMSVPALATADIEVLQGPEDRAEDILAKLQEMATGEEVREKPRPTPYLRGYRFDSFPYQDQIAEIIKQHTNHDMEIVRTRMSVGDENVLATLGIPVLTWGPSGGNEHRSNEYVEIESLDRIQAMYEDLLQKKVELTRV